MSVCPRGFGPASLALSLALSACADPPAGSAGRALLDEVPVYRLLGLEGRLSESRRKALEAQGVLLLLRRGGDEWLARASSTRGFEELEGELGIRSVRAARPEEKLRLHRGASEGGEQAQFAPRLRARALASPAAWLELRVLLAYDLDRDRRLRSAVEEQLRELDPDARRVGFLPLYQLRLPPSRLGELAGLEAVRHVELAPGPARPLLDETRAAIGAEGLHAIDLSSTPPTYALGGQGTVGAIWDPHGIDPSHPDLGPKLLRFPDPKHAPSIFHGTAVGGCLLGSGAASALPPNPWAPYQLRGIAPEAKLASYLTDGDRDANGKPSQFPEQYLEARNLYAADVVSMSFSHDLQAIYDSTAANLDQLIARTGLGLPEAVPILVAAGNEGWKYGYGSITSLASAKNIIAVGASDWADGRMVGFSSFGPTEDGRLKPELMAPGCASHAETSIGVDRVRLLAASGATVKEWSFASGLEGWSALQDLKPPTVNAGVLETQSTGGDPALLSPDGLALPAASIASVEVTMRLSHHHQAELFWKTDQAPSFQGSRRQAFLVNADGKLHTYAIKLEGNAEWKDTIAGIRLDPIASMGIGLPVPGGSYAPSCGTSMSTPIAAGGVLLLVQAWRAQEGSASRPTPAMVKALLVAGARDMVGQGPNQNPDLGGALTPYPAGPDFATGYGELDLARSVALLRGSPRPYLEAAVPYTGRRAQVRLRVLAAPSKPLSVTLGWDDPPGEPASKATLQNDLDLSVRSPAGQTLLPSTLSAKLPTQPALRTIDSVNNLEQVAIADPVPGDYLIRVIGAELAQPPQRFALVVSCAEPGVLGELALDADGDGSFAGEDCDDDDAEVFPGAKEILGNGRDDDCDPATPDQPAVVPADAGRPRDAAPRLDGGDSAAPPAGGCSCGLARSSSGSEAIGFLLGLAIAACGLRRRRNCACSPPSEAPRWRRN